MYTELAGCRHILPIHADSGASVPAFAGRMRLQQRPWMVGTGVWERRLCGTGIVRSQHRRTGTMLRASRSNGEDRRSRGSRSPFPYLMAAPTEAPVRPCPTPSASSLGDSSSRSAAQFASSGTSFWIAQPLPLRQAAAGRWLLNQLRGSCASAPTLSDLQARQQSLVERSDPDTILPQPEATIHHRTQRCAASNCLIEQEIA